MRRFKSLFVHLVAWPRASTRRTSKAIRSVRASGYFIPLTVSSIWWVHETDQPQRATPAATRVTLRIVRTTHVSRVERIRHVVSGFLLWFGLLFSAALLGTFIVLGFVLLYALLMSVIGH